MSDESPSDASSSSVAQNVLDLQLDPSSPGVSSVVSPNTHTELSPHRALYPPSRPRITGSNASGPRSRAARTAASGASAPHPAHGRATPAALIVLR
ncbi:hypothetical protein [Sorangium cellulosum]|uniref:Uncharacterized protein n=1 Tax=Sorangium cellulosum TaxID=56 RepID=A0A150QR36_SORCE|nr:hypothetical protein [Sorangium cellulosum]KYF70419.1 hypothetical protein BE15_16135 [Sorangium cellulosum]